MNIRIRIGTETVKQLLSALHKAYQSGDSRMVQRISAVLDYSRGDSPEMVSGNHGIATSSLYAWLKQLLVEGLNSLKPQWRGGVRLN